MSKAKAFEELTKTYGTVNRQPPTSQRVYTYRIGGGMVVPQSGNVPQAGSFQHLKELILTERARELQVSFHFFSLNHSNLFQIFLDFYFAIFFKIN